MSNFEATNTPTTNQSPPAAGTEEAIASTVKEPQLDNDGDWVKSFDDIGICDELLRGVYAYGFEKPSVVQSKAIPPIIKGKDTIAQAQSGTGKTAAFSISALQRVDPTLPEVQALLLAPTRELADQNYKVCRKSKLRIPSAPELKFRCCSSWLP